MLKKITTLGMALAAVSGHALGADTTPPQITALDFPGSPSGELVGGKVPFSVSATDDVGIARVELFEDGVLVTSDNEAPWGAVLDFNDNAADTEIVITARAVDSTGNSSTTTRTVRKPGGALADAGVTLLEGGCFFKLWAPNAEAVQLVGDFDPAYANGALGVHDLSEDSDGHWFGLVPGCAAGDRYKYVIDNPGGENNTAGRHWRLDPRAKDSDHSANGADGSEQDLDFNAGIVVDPAYDWRPFRSPAFNDYLIYQLHMGSFAGLNDGIDMSGRAGNGTIARFGDVETKLQYIRDLGFNAIELLPIQEFAADRSWGYNPALFFAIESAYGSPEDFRRFVDAAHKHGLAVIVDVVYNHAGPGDNSLWQLDGYTKDDGGIYFEGGQNTDWGRGPAWWKREVQAFFYDNARMYLTDYNVDGIRWDVTTQINGNHLKEVLRRLGEDFPDKYMIAEHLPAHPWIIETGNYDATWLARSHHDFQRAAAGNDPVNRVIGFLGWDDYDHAWNLVKYPLGSHDDIGDDKDGDAEHGLRNWDRRHRYFTDLFGGRDSWEARAKARMGWALAATMPGTPMLFMGTEFHFNPPWGYWHDGRDRNGDHRIDWSQASDATAMPMRRMVAAVNAVRWSNRALRSDTLSIPHRDDHNQVIGFKRWDGDNLVLTVVNLGGTNFTNQSYGVTADAQGQWTQVFCSQDAAFGGWHGACNAFYEPWTQGDGRIYINLPKYSVLVFKLK
jgi:1,4-alpha-glucan branching enzyme